MFAAKFPNITVFIAATTASTAAVIAPIEVPIKSSNISIMLPVLGAYVGIYFYSS
jgi:hypothetical protein